MLMRTMLKLSLLLNVAVLIPVCFGLMTRASWAAEAYGEATPARDILLAIYLSILFASVLLLVFRDPRAVAALLTVQVVYKLLTPATVGSLQNPVVLSNLGIAVVHAVTLFAIWRAIGNPFRGQSKEA